MGLKRSQPMRKRKIKKSGSYSESDRQEEIAIRKMENIPDEHYDEGYYYGSNRWLTWVSKSNQQD